MKKKRFIALLIAVLMASNTFTGCVNSVADENTTSATEMISMPEESSKVKTSVEADEIVEVIMPILTEGDESEEDYIADLKKENSDFLSAELYKEGYCKVTMYDSVRQNYLNDMGDISQYLITTFEEEEDYKGLFTDANFKTSDNGDYTFSLYCTSEAYENAAWSGLGAVIFAAMLANIYQGMNLIDITEITGTLKFIDPNTQEVLYDSGTLE